MKIINKILSLYFKIPRKIRFLVYYIVAFYMFITRDNSSLKIVYDGDIKSLITGFMSLPYLVIQAIHQGNILGMLLMFFLGWGVILALFLYYSLPITIVYFIERNVRIAIKRDNSKYSTKENILYYREILNNISPAVISIVDNFKIDFQKDIVAGVLKLVLSGHVKMDNNSLEIVEKSADDLSISQKELYDMIKDGKLENIEYDSWKTSCYREATNEGYVYLIQGLNQKHASTHLAKGALRLGIIFTISLILALLLSALGSIIISTFLILFIMIYVGFYFPYLIGYTIYYLLRKSDFRYTEKGEIVKNRIEGLKRFIEDYSSLDEKDKKEVVLWDDYLIYAVLFEQNKSIIKDMLRLKGLDLDVEFDEFSFVKDM
jgi:hypothetical protein